MARNDSETAVDSIAKTISELRKPQSPPAAGPVGRAFSVIAPTGIANTKSNGSLLFFENAEARNDVTITTTITTEIRRQLNGMPVNWSMTARAQAPVA